MSEEQIPSEIQGFLYQYIRSVAHLDMFLFLVEGKDRSWTAEELIKNTRTNESMVQKLLDDLKGVVSCDPNQPDSYRFSPCDQKTIEVVYKLRELYRTRQHAVINAIYSRPLDVIRSFADAFKIKKD